ncbi:MAG: serine hydroxymethyltransferase, partial [Acidobacteriota bacterium]
AAALQEKDFRIVSGGTDNHLWSVDVGKRGVTGRVAERELEKAGITVNKNTIPFDPLPPMVASGVRMGSPALTTRGMGTAEMRVIASMVHRVLSSVQGEGKAAAADPAVLEEVQAEVNALTARFPLYSSRQPSGTGAASAAD